MATRHANPIGKWHFERGSEKVSANPLETSKSYENLWNLLKTLNSRNTSESHRNYPTQRSSQGSSLRQPFSSQNLSGLLPPLMLPLNLPPITVPIPAKTKPSVMSNFYQPPQHCHVIFSVVVPTPENHQGLSKYPNTLVLSGYDRTIREHQNVRTNW